MFEYALNIRQFTIKFPNGKTYTANSIDNETVGFLTNDGDDLSAMTELTLIDDKATTDTIPASTNERHSCDTSSPCTEPYSTGKRRTSKINSNLFEYYSNNQQPKFGGASRSGTNPQGN